MPVFAGQVCNARLTTTFLCLLLLLFNRLEKKQHKQKEKSSDKKAKAMTPCGKLQESISSTSRTSSQNLLEKKMAPEPIVKVGSAAVEEELQQQRMLMRQRRLGLSLLRGEQADRMSSSSSASTRDSLTPATRTLSASQNNMPRSLKLPFRRLGVLKVFESAFCFTSCPRNFLAYMCIYTFECLFNLISY